MTVRILVADDEPDLLFMTAFTLRSLGGYEVIEAHNGEEALTLALQERPALLILDIKMPKMTGYEVCQRLRTEPDLAQVPVILLSAKGQKIELESGWEAGATEYILKPYAPEMLVKRVQELLEAA